MPIQKWIRPTLILNTLFFITLTSNAWAKVEEKPTLKTSYQSFVPKNWKILEKSPRRFKPRWSSGYCPDY